MHIQEIVKRIDENSKLLSEGNISEIDRDILLADLRSLYLIAKDISVKHVIVEQPKHVEQPKPVIEDTAPVVPVKEDIIEPPVEQKPIEVTQVITPKEEPKQIATIKEPEPAPVIEFVKEETKSRPTSLNEVFAGEERSLNQRLSANDKRPALNDHAGRKDLKSLIDFNKQYVLTNELFKGDSQAFQTAVKHINDAPTIEAAFEYIKTDLLPKYNWNSEMQSTRLFDKLVRQKFGL